MGGRAQISRPQQRPMNSLCFLHYPCWKLIDLTSILSKDGPFAGPPNALLARS
jgi:hypothetical protein